jgi:hypothetical protein
LHQQTHHTAQRNKPDAKLADGTANDATGIARILQTGWFKEVRVKDLDSHAVKALLASRPLIAVRDPGHFAGTFTNCSRFTDPAFSRPA